MSIPSASEQKLDLRSAEWFKHPGVVYFISAGEDCAKCKSIKIGVTLRERLLKRLTAIQSSNHTRVKLLRVIECETMKAAEDIEKDLHSRFAVDARVKGTVGYEWFKATDELMRLIAEQGTLPGEMNNQPACIGAVLKLFI